MSEQIYNVSQLEEAIFAFLNDHVNRHRPLQQGIIGIHLPRCHGTVERYEFLDALMHLDEAVKYDLQVIVLPPPLIQHFNIDNPTQADALYRRVQRDHDDGIRYNRLYIALYTEYPSDKTIQAHDVWFDTFEHHPGYNIVVTDHRKLPDGDKVIFSNSMKSVVATILPDSDPKDNESIPDILFSQRSMNLRLGKDQS